jgi:hydroxymethylpyrimidine/phosphomethylpyrimidine kinase
VRVALTIAGSDSGGGAGIQADLKTFAAHGVHGACAITAVTAQNTTTVEDILVLPASAVVQQIEAVASDMKPAAVKTGMLATPEIAQAVAASLRRHGLRNLVVDPVLQSSTGHALASGAAARAFFAPLLDLAAVLTPNIPEAEALLEAPVRNLEDMREAARRIAALGPRAVVVKGGHREGDAVDVLWDGTAIHELRAERLATPHTHGTGCTFSAALTARLAVGTPLVEAVRAAKDYVTEAIRGGYAVGAGRGVLDHGFGPRIT